MNDPTRKSESDSSSLPRDFETLSASLSKDLSRGLPIDMENALKQIPKERQHEFLERFRSLALGFGSVLLIRAIEILDGIGEDWNANLSKFHLAMIYYKLGRLDDALVEANSVFERCIGNGDARSGCSAYALLRVSEGILDGGKIASMRHQTPTDTLATCNIEKGLAIWHLRHGRTQEAIEAASKACQLPLKRKLPNFHSFASGPVALMVHRSILEDMPTNSSEYSRHLKATKRLARYSALLARLCPSEASFI